MYPKSTSDVEHEKWSRKSWFVKPSRTPTLRQSRLLTYLKRVGSTRVVTEGLLRHWLRSLTNLKRGVNVYKRGVGILCVCWKKGVSKGKENSRNWKYIVHNTWLKTLYPWRTKTSNTWTSCKSPYFDTNGTLCDFPVVGN